MTTLTLFALYVAYVVLRIVSPEKAAKIKTIIDLRFVKVKLFFKGK